METQLLDTLETMRLDHDPGGKVRRNLAADVEGYALFGGPRREYRYILRRVWNQLLPATMFVMMNPSVADIRADDPTVARCQTFARNWGSGCLYVVNTFAYRATDQRQLLAVPEPPPFSVVWAYFLLASKGINYPHYSFQILSLQ
jgi:hypothetical protein